MKFKIADANAGADVDSGRGSGDGTSNFCLFCFGLGSWAVGFFFLDPRSGASSDLGCGLFVFDAGMCLRRMTACQDTPARGRVRVYARGWRLGGGKVGSGRGGGWGGF